MSASGAKKCFQSHAALIGSTAILRPSLQTRCDLATSMHCGILEPDHFAARVVTAPNVNKRTNAGKEELAAFQAAHAGKGWYLSAADMTRAQACISAPCTHPRGIAPAHRRQGRRLAVLARRRVWRAVQDALRRAQPGRIDRRQDHGRRIAGRFRPAGCKPALPRAGRALTGGARARAE